MGGQTQVTEEESRRVFADTIDKAVSGGGILVRFLEGDARRKVFGFPYTIIDGNLEIGPYAKDMHEPTPRDYHERKMPIPLRGILSYRRVEPSHFVSR